MARERRVGPRAVALRACGCLIALFVSCALVVGGAAGYFTMRGREALESAERTLAGRVAIAKARRWTRPVLRGEPIEGNAASAHRAALDALPRDLDAAPLEAFRALRDATRRSYAASPPSLSPERLEEDDAAREREHERVIAAAERIVVLAQTAGADECLRVCTDVVRVAQDRSPGQPVEEPLHVMPAVMTRVVEALPQCARLASSAARTAAKNELTSLARHPAPIGWAFELRLLRGSAAMLSGAREWPGILFRPRSVEAATYNLSFAPAYAAMSATEYPTSFAPVERDAVECPRRSGIGSCRDERPDLFVDAAQQALLRALAVGVDALVAADHGNVTIERGPASLDDPTMRVPFSGAPLRFLSVASPPSTAAPSVRIYSVGPNRVDDGGDAALDLGVTFVLAPSPGAEDR